MLELAIFILIATVVSFYWDSYKEEKEDPLNPANDTYLD